MLGKRTRPVNAKFHEPAITIEKTMSSDVNTSPKSPLDMKIRSPRGLKNCNIGGGVGLGIVAELDKSCGSQVPVKFILGSLNLTRSDPIPIGSPKPSTQCVGSINMGCWDDYTCVTSHGPNKSCTRVYFDGGENMLTSKGNFDRSWTKPVAFRPSPQPRFVEEFPTSNFLSSCYLCRKELHGKDIYMYRGEKAFCSTECRYRQIVSDERKEKCRSEASRSIDISVSPYSGGQLFSTGIFAV